MSRLEAWEEERYVKRGRQTYLYLIQGSFGWQHPMPMLCTQGKARRRKIVHRYLHLQHEHANCTTLPRWIFGLGPQRHRPVRVSSQEIAINCAGRRMLQGRLIAWPLCVASAGARQVIIRSSGMAKHGRRGGDSNIHFVQIAEDALKTAGGKQCPESAKYTLCKARRALVLALGGFSPLWAGHLIVDLLVCENVNGEMCAIDGVLIMIMKEAGNMSRWWVANF